MNDLVPFDAIERMAAVMGRNKMFGKTKDELMPLMLIAQAEGKHPAIAAQEYDIIQGQPAIKSKAALARFQTCGGRVAWKTRTDTEAEAVFSHPQADPVSIKWTIKDAERANLTSKDNWKKYPRQMLAARVVAEGIRACFPACLSGMYTEEEVRDFDNLPQMPERQAEIMNDDEPLATKEEVTALCDELSKTPDERKKLNADFHGDLDAIKAELLKEKADKAMA